MLSQILWFQISSVGLKVSQPLLSLLAEPGSRACVPQTVLSSTASLDLTKFPAFPKTCLGQAYMKMHVKNQNETTMLYMLFTIILLFLCVVSWVKGFLELPGLVSCSIFVLCC